MMATRKARARCFPFPGDIVMEGFLSKESKHLKSWRPRWFVLTPDYLCSFANRGDYRNTTEFVHLKQCSTVKSADNEVGSENSLCVVTQGRVFNLIANDSIEKEKWIGAISRQMVRQTVLTEDHCE